MADVMSTDKRSALMSRIKGKNTSPEMTVRRQLWAAGFRYRLHDKTLTGRPDLVLPRWRAVVFVHGCFWHSHDDCIFAAKPKTRPEFWEAKLGANRRRDAAVIEALSVAGWRVAVVWECALRASAEHSGKKLIDWIRNGDSTLQLRAEQGRLARRGRR